MGKITLTTLRDTAVDFSYPYFFDRLGFISKKPSPISKLTAILWPYQDIVWITIVAAVPFFSVIYWMFSFSVLILSLKEKRTYIAFL